MKNNTVVIFTDGSSRGNPGPGGWGTIIIDGELVTELGGAENPTTNNRMEITAALEAIEALDQAKIDVTRNIVVYTDSSYLIKGITSWIHGWIRNGWMTSQKEAVVNQDLWEALHRVTRNKKIEWSYIGGHSGIPGNERCDEIATGSADKTDVKLFKGQFSDYPVKNVLETSNPAGAAKKAKSKSGSKVAAYSYVSAVGGKVQIHKTWKECEDRVRGVSGAKFKKSISASDEADLVKKFS